jgi:hypothetical protein
VRLGDALDDRQAEPDARLIGADPLGAALERLGQRGGELRFDPLAGVLDGQAHRAWVQAGRDPHRPVLRQIVDDRVVHEVRRHLQQQRMRADGGGQIAGGLDGEAPLLGQGQQRLGGLLRDEGEVDLVARERALVGAA